MRNVLSNSILLLSSFFNIALAISKEDRYGDGADIVTMPLLNHDQLQARRRRELNNSSDKDDSKLSNYHPSGQLFQGYGTHYVDLWVGYPDPQRQTLIVDTGSDVTAFPCEPCPDCGQDYHTDGFFKGHNSETFNLTDCELCKIGKCRKLDDDFNFCSVGMSYAEGSSWYAYESTDIAYFGGHHSLPKRRRKNKRRRGLSATSANELEKKFKQEAVDMKNEFHRLHPTAKDFAFELMFGCQYKITGLFKTQLADGIMGMERSDNSFWMQMYNAKKIRSRSFALCFAHSHDAKRDGSSGGLLTLGGADARIHKSPMIFAENHDSQGWYSIYINGMYLKKPKKNDDEDDKIEKLILNIEKVNEVGVIVDSGTTESFLPLAIRKPFSEAFLKVMGFPFKDVVPKPESEDDLNPLEDYPTIMIQLKAALQVTDDEFMDETGHPLEGMANKLDLNAPNDVILEITPRSYMAYRKSLNAYSNRLHMGEATSYGVLGANSMYGHDILFDTDKNRIGFAKSNCDYAELENDD